MISLIIIALAPVFVIAIYIYSRDKYEKEPLPLLLKAILAGIIIVLPIIYSEQLMSLIGANFTGVAAGAWKAFMVAALCEETFKYLALFILFWKNKEFNEKYDGIIYATFISLGFAGIENVMYVLDTGISTGFARALTAVPAHAVMGISMGYFWGLAKFYPIKRKKYLLWSFLLPFTLHGVYDFILMSGLSYLLLLFIPMVIYMWLAGLKKMKKLNETSYFRDDLDIGMDFSQVRDYQTTTSDD